MMMKNKQKKTFQAFLIMTGLMFVATVPVSEPVMAQAEVIT
jgi:hypothetical protein